MFYSRARLEFPSNSRKLRGGGDRGRGGKIATGRCDTPTLVFSLRLGRRGVSAYGRLASACGAGEERYRRVRLLKLEKIVSACRTARARRYTYIDAYNDVTRPAAKSVLATGPRDGFYLFASALTLICKAYAAPEGLPAPPFRLGFRGPSAPALKSPVPPDRAGLCAHLTGERGRETVDVSGASV